jgi:hypothetical protein
MDELRGLQEVRLDKKVLIAKLTENRDNHRAVFIEALEGYHKAVVKALETQLADAKAGRKYQPNVALPVPQDHTADYNQALDLLQMSLDDELVLTAREFSQYVRDDWGWKPDFITTASSYTLNQ